MLIISEERKWQYVEGVRLSNPREEGYEKANKLLYSNLRREEEKKSLQNIPYQ